MSNVSGKPSWDDAPEWAKWLAMDRDGEWFFYEEKPLIGGDRWLVTDFHSRRKLVGVPTDWKNTLEPRPDPLDEISKTSEELGGY